MNRSMIRQLTVTELKLNLRDPFTIGFGVVLPVALLAALGSIPGVDEPDPAIGGLRGIDTWVPSLSFTMAVALMAWFLLPVVLATYRERGVLRRFATTPARPAALLAAQLIANLLVVAVAVAVVFVVGPLVVGLGAPRNVLGFAVVLVAGILAMFGIGLFMASVIPSQRAAQGIMWLVFAPSAFLAGVYVPIHFLPDWVVRIGDFTPLAAFRTAIEDVWIGDGPRPLHVAVLVAAAVLSWLGAARLFRTE
jgi:ABC-2 type transport system permease protein